MFSVVSQRKDLTRIRNRGFYRVVFKKICRRRDDIIAYRYLQAQVWSSPSYAQIPVSETRRRENFRDLFVHDSPGTLSVRGGSGLERVTRIFIKRYEHRNERDENQYLTTAWEFSPMPAYYFPSVCSIPCLHTFRNHVVFYRSPPSPNV